MPDICTCGHAETTHPTRMSVGDPSRGLPPLPQSSCTSPACSCQHYQQDRSKVTDSERLVLIEDMLKQVLRKLK
jgi:hypothetical protein